MVFTFQIPSQLGVGLREGFVRLECRVKGFLLFIPFLLEFLDLLPGVLQLAHRLLGSLSFGLQPAEDYILYL